MSIHRTCRHPVVAALALAMAAACADAPTRPDARPPAADPPPAPLVAGPGARVLTPAESAIHATAAAWAAGGNRTLQDFLATDALWSESARSAFAAASGGPSAVPAPPIPPSGAAETGVPPTVPITPETFPRAYIVASSTQAFTNGAAGAVTSIVTYYGVRAHTDVTYSSNDDRGQVVNPKTIVSNEGYSEGAIGCLSNTTASCTFLGSLVTPIANINFGRSCGVTLSASAHHRAWFQLPIPLVDQILTRWHWYLLEWGWNTGDDQVANASNGPCPTEVVTQPVCGTQLIYDATTCDDGGGDNPALLGAADPQCTLWLIQIEQSYDGGRTWYVVDSWIEQRC